LAQTEKLEEELTKWGTHLANEILKDPEFKTEHEDITVESSEGLASASVQQALLQSPGQEE